ncbi:hypothetical protein UA08_04115 [Talaromyces atroroseus]|uniref:Sigma-70 region 2 family protein n=1 Tax=Talaromyces atroroseus TaxID=1441469 RepID=A0A1Q5Q913_TALAT|nr:hypothetical protein UA08_04115 [Talaromyces atroroseus]OKL60605.1 hypothetical protein UA08_04115 [Talaromyces atroroseus]
MSQSRWQFIDSSKNSADNLTQVKRHVMQEYMRQKRLENKHEDSGQVGTKKRSRAKKTKVQPQARAAGEGAYFNFNLTSSPRTILSAARTDPFDALPWQASKEDQRLFDFYVHEMPACSYGHHFRTKKAHNWYTEVFVPEAMKGALTFVNTILVHGANTWAWVRNETETESTLRYRQLGISMLRDHTQKHPHDMTDNVITACMSAAALEDFDPRPGHKEISWIHMRQAQRLIRRRGGPAAFQNTTLARLINWQDYILAGYVSDPDGFYFENNHRFPSDAARPSPNTCLPSPPNSASPATSDRTPSPTRFSFTNTPEQEIALQCEEFLDFLGRCERLALSQRMALPPNNASVRHTGFGPASPLHHILISPAEKRRTVTGDRKQFIARLAALLMLNAAMWDYRLSVRKTEAFLAYSIHQLQESEVNVGSSIEALLQILLACKDFPLDENLSPVLHPVSQSPAIPDLADFSQYSDTATSPFARPWFVGRMLKVAKRLGLQTWLRLNNFLFECLTLQVQEHTMLSWGPHLRFEILQAPLTSYVMPALQEAVFLGV